MSFTRRVENFKCRHCGKSVEGNGYTNHCPFCFWSRHVDIDPGDRLERCKGMMEPVGVEGAQDAYRIIHRCIVCGAARVVKAAENDNAGALIAIARDRVSVAQGDRI